MPPATASAERTAWRHGRRASGARIVPEETPIALVYDGATEAVMMATPADLEDFAVGFSLTERIVDHLDQVKRMEIVPQSEGVEARLWLAPGLASTRATRRRRLTGPTGCGLCGVESLEAAVRPVRSVGDDDLRFAAGDVAEAMADLEAAQPLNAVARAVHAAALWRAGTGLVCVREDVGRHNALDKLAGALARRGETAEGGAVLLTSRVSVEMVQKAAAIGAPLIVAVSAPTALALRVAQAAGVTVAAVARSDGFEIFTRPERIVLG